MQRGVNGSKHYGVDDGRYGQLFLFNAASFVNAVAMNSYNPFGEACKALFGYNGLSVTFMQLYLVAYVTTSISTLVFIDVFTVSAGLKFGAVIQAIGCCIRLLAVMLPIGTSLAFVISAMAQFMIGMSQGFFVNTFTLFAVQWFPLDEKDSVINKMIAVNACGGSAAFVIPLLTNITMDNVDGDETKTNIMLLRLCLGVTAIAAAATATGWLTFGRERPCHVPSRAAELQSVQKRNLHDELNATLNFRCVASFDTFENEKNKENVGGRQCFTTKMTLNRDAYRQSERAKNLDMKSAFSFSSFEEIQQGTNDVRVWRSYGFPTSPSANPSLWDSLLIPLSRADSNSDNRLWDMFLLQHTFIVTGLWHGLKQIHKPTQRGFEQAIRKFKSDGSDHYPSTWDGDHLINLQETGTELSFNLESLKGTDLDARASSLESWISFYSPSDCQELYRDATDRSPTIRETEEACANMCLPAEVKIHSETEEENGLLSTDSDFVPPLLTADNRWKLRKTGYPNSARTTECATLAIRGKTIVHWGFWGTLFSFTLSETLLNFISSDASVVFGRLGYTTNTILCLGATFVLLFSLTAFWAAEWAEEMKTRDVKSRISPKAANKSHRWYSAPRDRQSSAFVQGIELCQMSLIAIMMGLTILAFVGDLVLRPGITPALMCFLLLLTSATLGPIQGLTTCLYLDETHPFLSPAESCTVLQMCGNLGASVLLFLFEPLSASKWLGFAILLSSAAALIFFRIHQHRLRYSRHLAGRAPFRPESLNACSEVSAHVED